MEIFGAYNFDVNTSNLCNEVLAITSNNSQGANFVIVWSGVVVVAAAAVVLERDWRGFQEISGEREESANLGETSGRRDAQQRRGLGKEVLGEKNLGRDEKEEGRGGLGEERWGFFFGGLFRSQACPALQPLQAWQPDV